MNNNLMKAIEQLSAREGYYLPLLKAKIFKDLEKITQKVPLVELLVEYKNGIWGKEYLEDGLEVKVLRSPDVRFGFIDSENAEKRFVSKMDYQKHKLEFGDILVIKSNGSQDLVGKSQVFNIEEENVIPSNFVMKLRPNLEIMDVNYLDLFLKSPQSLMWRFENQTTSTGLRNLKTKEYLNTLIPLPSREIQKDIVHFFNECFNGRFEESSLFVINEYEKIYNLMNEQDLFKKNIRNQSNITQHLKTKILQKAVQGELLNQEEKTDIESNILKLIKIEKEKLIKEMKIKKEKNSISITDEKNLFKLPKGWVWTHLGTIAKNVEYGTSQKASEEEIGIPVLRMNNILNGKLSLSNLKFVSEEIKDLPRLLLERGDLLFNRTNSYELVGKTAMFNEPGQFTFASYLIRIRLVDKYVNAEYINIVMNSEFYRTTQIEPKIIQQNGQANFNGTKLKNTFIPLPPLEEQNRIVDKVNKLMNLCDSLEESINEAKVESKVLMESIVRKIITVEEKLLS